MKRIYAVATAGLLAAGLVASSVLVVPAYAQTVSADTIVNQLQPKKPLTRSFKAPSAADAEDQAFLKSLPTRGLRIDQRKKLDEIVAKQELPKIDITINFDYDSDRIRPESIADVSELGKALTSDALASARIVLNGHTDAAGSDAYNQNLSERRAAAVRDFLVVKFNIDANRLVTAGYGEERLKNVADPLAPENRRVEVINLTSG